MTARLVAVGRKLPEDKEFTFDYALTEPAPKLPEWLWNGGKRVEDDDLYRKQQAEDHIAWGEEL